MILARNLADSHVGWAINAWLVSLQEVVSAVVVVVVRVGIFIAKRAVHGVLVVVDGLNIALIIELVVKLGMGHMIGLLVVIAGRLVMVSVVSLGIDRAVVGLGVASGVNVVRVHRIVVVRVFIGGSLTMDVVSCHNAVFVTLIVAAVMTIRVSVLSIVGIVHSVLVVMDGLNIALIVKLVV